MTEIDYSALRKTNDEMYGKSFDRYLSLVGQYRTNPSTLMRNKVEESIGVLEKIALKGANFAFYDNNDKEEAH